MTSEFLYPTPGGQAFDIRQIDGQYEVFTLVERTIKERLSAFIAPAGPSAVNTPADEPLLAGSLAKALAYVARIERQKQLGTRINSRILLVTGSNECASQYMTYMNVFFTAQKQQIVIDVCSLDKPLGLLQQGCDITGGQYLRLPQLDGLLQYLLVSLWNDSVSVVTDLKRLRCIAVGVPAGSADALEAGAAAADARRLSGRVLLSPRAHRHRLRVLRVPVE